MSHHTQDFVDFAESLKWIKNRTKESADKHRSLLSTRTKGITIRPPSLGWELEAMFHWFPTGTVWHGTWDLSLKWIKNRTKESADKHRSLLSTRTKGITIRPPSLGWEKMRWDWVHLCSPAVADERAAYLSRSHTLLAARLSRLFVRTAGPRSISSCGDFLLSKSFLSWQSTPFLTCFLDKMCPAVVEESFCSFRLCLSAPVLVPLCLLTLLSSLGQNDPPLC